MWRGEYISLCVYSCVHTCICVWKCVFVHMFCVRLWRRVFFIELFLRAFPSELLPLIVLVPIHCICVYLLYICLFPVAAYIRCICVYSLYLSVFTAYIFIFWMSNLVYLVMRLKHCVCFYICLCVLFCVYLCDSSSLCVCTSFCESGCLCFWRNWRKERGRRREVFESRCEVARFMK